MTFFHFLNCATLAFAPYYVLYKSSSLSDLRAGGACLFAALVNLLTQTAKMLLLATIAPAAADEGQVSLLQDCVSAVVSVLDFGGLLFLMRSRVGGSLEGVEKILSVGLGWAAGDAALSYALPIFFGARGSEFSWEYVRMAIQSNIGLIHFLTLAAVVYLYSRRKFSRSLLPVLGAVAATQAVVLPLVVSYLRHSNQLPIPTVLGLQSGLTLLSALVMRGLYQYHNQPRQSTRS